ncbi:MAG: hypothetical protein JXL97_15405, partial [Bacteroidales bacterium]|nr:hypothetical protein [Bacteroidales bacterium]
RMESRSVNLSSFSICFLLNLAIFYFEGRYCLTERKGHIFECDIAFWSKYFELTSGRINTWCNLSFQLRDNFSSFNELFTLIFCKMNTVTVTIFENTSKGKDLSIVLNELAKTGMDIRLRNSGNVSKWSITERTGKEQALIGLLRELQPGVGFSIQTEQKSRLEQLSEEFTSD